MTREAVYAGLDVSKARLDVACRRATYIAAMGRGQQVARDCPSGEPPAAALFPRLDYDGDHCGPGGIHWWWQSGPPY